MNSSSLINHLNNLEEWLDENKSRHIYFPLRMAGYLLLILVMIFSNLLAIIRWPFAFLKRSLQSNERLSSYQVSTTAVNEVNPDQLDKILKNREVVLIDFWAEWCGPCIMMNKPLQKLAASKDAKCTIAKVNTMKHKELADQYQVKGLPTLLLVKNNQEVKRYAGALSYPELKEFISH